MSENLSLTQDLESELSRLSVQQQQEDDSESIVADEPLFVIRNTEELKIACRRYRICEESLSLLNLKKKKICAVIAEQIAPLKHEKSRLEPAISSYLRMKNHKCISVDEQKYLLATKSSSKKAQKDDILSLLSGMGIDEPDKVYEIVNSKVKRDNFVIKMDV